MNRSLDSKMVTCHNKATFSLLTLSIVSMALTAFTVSSFTLQKYIINHNAKSSKTQLDVKSAVAPSSTINVSGKGFAPTTTTTTTTTSDNENDDISSKESIMKMNPTQIKEKILDLLPRMTGTSEEFRLVEDYINALEDKFIPPQTLDFLNLAMVGEWQFLFTSNQLGRPSPKLRLTELIQKVEVDGFDGKLTNKVSCLGLVLFTL